MIPNNRWSADNTLKPFATYGKTVPAVNGNAGDDALKMITLGPQGALSRPWNKDLADWWLFAYEDGAVNCYRYVPDALDGAAMGGSDAGAWQFDSALFALPACKKLSGTFDQNGKPLVFFDTGSELRLWWYDPLLSATTTTVFGVGHDPFATFDLKYGVDTEYSDALLFYLRAGAIYYRLQRDRYALEYATPVTADAVLIKAADMAIDYRMQLVYRARDKGFAPPPAVPPVVAPTQGAWHYLLSGYQSYVDTRAIALQLMQPFSVTLTLAQFEPSAATVCLWSQQQHPHTGLLALCFTGANFDVLRLLYGGSWFEAKLPFGLCAGTWRTEVLWRGNGYGLLVTHTARDGVVSQGGVIIGRFDPTVQSGGAMLRLGAMNGFGGEAIHCLRAAISEVRITPHAQAPELRIAMTKKPQHSDLQAITLGDGSASSLGDALIVGYRDANWLFMPG